MAFAARSATVQLPWGQLAMVGIGIVCVTNPDKFFDALARTTRLLQAGSSSTSNSAAAQPPTIIYSSPPVAIQNGSKAGFVVQLVVGATLCWGSYAVLIYVLPEAAKGMLPVNRTVFNKAVTGLGRAVMNLKDALMTQIKELSSKQDELGEKQDETHNEVLEVKTNVQDIRGDLGLVQEALDLCHASLTESERRTTYITQGVQLLTRGVSTILPEDENLLQELVQFNIRGDQFKTAGPMEQRRIQQAITAMRNRNTPSNNISNTLGTPERSVDGTSQAPSMDPENEHPCNPDPVEHSVREIPTLLRMAAY